MVNLTVLIFPAWGWKGWRPQHGVGDDGVIGGGIEGDDGPIVDAGEDNTVVVGLEETTN
jgi:hypothetical protein